MNKLLADVRGIYATTFRLLAEPKVLKVHIVVGLIYGATIFMIFITIAVTAVLLGNIDFERLSAREAAVLAAIALILFFPVNFLISRLLHFAAAEQPRPRYFRDFRISRNEWVNAVLLLFLVVAISVVSTISIDAPAEESIFELCTDLLVYSFFSSAVSIPILISITVFAVHDPLGWVSAWHWLRQMFMPMFTAFLLLTVGGSFLSLPFEGAFANTDSGEGFNSVGDVAMFLSVVFLLLVMLMATFVLTFALIAGGYRYWRETYVP